MSLSKTKGSFLGFYLFQLLFYRGYRPQKYNNQEGGFHGQGGYRGRGGHGGHGGRGNYNKYDNYNNQGYYNKPRRGRGGFHKGETATTYDQRSQMSDKYDVQSTHSYKGQRGKN